MCPLALGPCPEAFPVHTSPATLSFLLYVALGWPSSLVSAACPCPCIPPFWDMPSMGNSIPHPSFKASSGMSSVSMTFGPTSPPLTTPSAASFPGPGLLWANLATGWSLQERLMRLMSGNCTPPVSVLPTHAMGLQVPKASPPLQPEAREQEWAPQCPDHLLFSVGKVS